MTLGKFKSKSKDATADVAVKEKKPRKKIKLKKIITYVVVAAVIAAGAYMGLSHMTGTDLEGEITYTDEAVELRTITQSISSSGTLTAANSYTVTTLVEGEIIWDGVDEGTIVEKDDLLYEIDSSDVSNTLEKAEISLTQSQRSYDSMVDSQYIYSDYTGELYELLVDTGDVITMGQTIGYTRDNRTMELKVAFPSDDAAGFYVGQSATVTLSGTFETLTGTVTNVSNSTEILSGTRIVRNVTVSITNNGGLSDTQEATVTIGGVGSSSSGTLAYASTGTITSDTAGEVTSMSVDEGDFIYKNARILTVGGDDMSDNLQSASESLRTTELTYESAQDALDNYSFTAPIAGTMIEKYYKTGDNVEAGDALCIIYDLAYLEIVMSIDELDIQNISVGQSVDIIADSMDTLEFTGTVTKVSVAGTTMGGTTTYPVTVQLNDYGSLLPGMNVSTEIVVEEVVDVISISNVVIQRDNLVLVTADSPSAVNAVEGEEAPEGYVYVAVETGLSDDDYVEITAGLTMEDTVASITLPTVVSADAGMMMPGMESGMSDPGMSSGMSDPGMSSGMSSGGMGR
ncbi:HlyD family efflux transporter periplasmic adaptor subunit [Bengtsoniella intestinalis]|uniref:efflux RND transporter periplasmic adaptor subunit n=1 Tax=Bengtsoniella intestinalis TaxID=3073143 RepID=UPI00391F8F3F